MFSLRTSNVRSLLLLGTWLALWAIVLNLALFAGSRTVLLSWLPDRQTGLGFLTDNRQRIQGAEEEYRRGLVADKRLGAVVGISNIREAVDLDIMNQQLGARWRFIGVAGAGADSASIVENASILLDSSLRPELVVLGVTPLLMLDRAAPGNAIASTSSTYDRVKAVIKPAIWLSARRPDVSVSTERALLALRAKLFSIFGVHLATSDTASPWRSMLRLMRAEHYPKRVLHAGLSNAAAAGDFDITSFERAHIAPREIGQTLARFATRGARTIVVLTPEHSMLRSREPAGVSQMIARRLRETSGVSSLTVFDCRSALPDSGLVDLVHPNLSGSHQFTRVLLDIIQSGSATASKEAGEQQAGASPFNRCSRA